MLTNITIMILIIVAITIKFVTASHISVKADNQNINSTVDGTTAAAAAAAAAAGIVPSTKQFIVSASEATLLTSPTYGHHYYYHQQQQQYEFQINELSEKMYEDNVTKRRNMKNFKKIYKKKAANMEFNIMKNLYKIVKISTNCTRNIFQMNIELNRPFHGIIYAKDFNCNECRSRGTSEKNITLKLPTSGCGVRVDTHSNNNTMELIVYVMIQIEEKLRQSTDLLKTVRCILPQNAMGLTLAEVATEITNITTLTKMRTSKMHAGLRNGRTQYKNYSTTMPYLNHEINNNTNNNNNNNNNNNVSNNRNDNKNINNYDDYIDSNMKLQQLNDIDMVTISTISVERHDALAKDQHKHQSLQQQHIDINDNNTVHQITNQHPQYGASTPRVRIWLELGGPDGSGSVMVGQATTLTVRAIVPGNMGVRIVDCAALDGLGESTQQLLDDRGCPIDEQVMPALQMDYQPAEEGWSKQDKDELLERTYKATFPAFKFPDRERLHVSCGVQLCKEQCPNVNCQSEDSLTLSNDKHLARIDIFNSLAVTAPQIEMDRLRYDPLYNMTVIDYPSYVRPLLNDGILCLSVSKLAISFCILGLIFLTAVIVAILSLIRSRKHFIHYRGSSSSGIGGVPTGYDSSTSNALMSTVNNHNRLLQRTEICTSMFSSSSDSTQSPVRFGSKLFIPYYPTTFPYGRVY